MKTIFYIFCFIPLHFFSQNYTLSGYVEDLLSEEKLINATVYEVNSERGTITNNYGYYSLSLPAGQPIMLIASYIGYSSDTLSVNLINHEKYNFSLLPDNNLDEVVIEAHKGRRIEQRNDIGIISIPVDKIKTFPSIGGESDIIKILQLMPGVQSGYEASSLLFVRGGSPDQNLILLDDVPMYNVTHLLGYISTFNTDALNSIKLIKGGFSASYGNRLSSVLDIRMKEGSLNSFHGSGMIGVLSSKISIEGPLIKGQSSFVISARRMLYDLVKKTFYSINRSNNQNNLFFYDFNAKINHRVSEKNHLFFSYYMGDDAFMDSHNSYFKEEEGRVFDSSKVSWGNRLFAFRWNHLFSQKIFSNLVLSYTNYSLKYRFSNSYNNLDEHFEENANYNSGIQDVRLKTALEYFYHPHYNLKFGMEGTKHLFNPGSAHYLNSIDEDFMIKNKHLNSLEMAVYLENNIKISKKLDANIGVRYVSYFVNANEYTSWEPRIRTNFQLLKSFSIKTSYTKMQQNVHLLTTGNIGLPIDLWMPATEYVAPQQSEQYSLEVAKSFEDFEVSLEAYYKTMNHLISYKEGASYYNITNDWEQKVEMDGVGISKGIELLINKKYGKNSGWLAYTFSKSERRFNDINFGKYYPYKFDKRHLLSVVYQYRLSPNVNLSATWDYSSGGALSLPEAKYQILTVPSQYIGHYSTIDNQESDTFSGADIRYYNGKNGFRMRDFHKLDIGANFIKKTKWGERTWNISVYNVYNRQNPHYYYFQGDEKNSNKLKLMQQSLFPIMPSVSYSWKF